MEVTVRRSKSVSGAATGVRNIPHTKIFHMLLSSIIIKNKHKHCEKIAFYTLLLMGSKLLIDYPKAVVTLLLVLPSNVLIC